MSLHILSRLLPISIALTTLPACGLLQRSEHASNVEDALPSPSALEPAPKLEQQQVQRPAPARRPPPAGRFDFEGVAGLSAQETAPPPQRVNPADVPNPSISAARALFAEALQEQKDGAFVKAESLWRRFLMSNAGMPGYHRALLHHATCLLALDRTTEAIEPLKALVLDSEDTVLANDARILLAEGLLATGDREQALALTYEVLPDLAAEKEAGIRRAQGAIGTGKRAYPTLVQRVRLYTLRGQIFGALQKDAPARSALEKAKLLLVGSRKGQLNAKEFQFLSSNYAWRQIEIQALTCGKLASEGDRLSEAEFLAYADAYYDCALPARNFYCTVLAAGNEQIRVQALRTYKALVEAPLKLRDNLPPPARPIKKPEQRSQYESEMKALIERTVEERAREFRNIDSCHAKNVF